jgi:hypothetical protein
MAFDMQLIMALSIYINSIRDKPIISVPVTPDMLYWPGSSEQEYDDALSEISDVDDEDVDAEWESEQAESQDQYSEASEHLLNALEALPPVPKSEPCVVELPNSLETERCVLLAYTCLDLD